jgi:hypothetical protein
MVSGEAVYCCLDRLLLVVVVLKALEVWLRVVIYLNP